MGWRNQETREALRKKGQDREWWEQFLSDVANGDSLKALCADELLTVGETLRWISEDAERQTAFDRALKIAAEVKVLEAMEIADDDEVEVARAKLRIDTRYRQAAKWSPQRYGERSVLEHTGRVESISITLALEQATQRVIEGRVERVVEPVALAAPQEAVAERLAQRQAEADAQRDAIAEAQYLEQEEI